MDIHWILFHRHAVSCDGQARPVAQVARMQLSLTDAWRRLFFRIRHRVQVVRKVDANPSGSSIKTFHTTIT